MIARSLLIALLAFGAPAAVPAIAPAQSAEEELERLIEGQADELLQGDDDLGSDTIDPSESGGVVGGAAPGGDPLEEPDPPEASPGDDPADGGFDPAVGAAAPAPVPPPYLVAGPAAQERPIDALASVTEPQLAADPLRWLVLGGGLLALLALAVAAALRALGLREPLASPVTAAPGRLRRSADRATLLADDVRDFLRRRR